MAVTFVTDLHIRHNHATVCVRASTWDMRVSMNIINMQCRAMPSVYARTTLCPVLVSPSCQIELCAFILNISQGWLLLKTVVRRSSFVIRRYRHHRGSFVFYVQRRLVHYGKLCAWEPSSTGWRSVFSCDLCFFFVDSLDWDKKMFVLDGVHLHVRWMAVGKKGCC